MDESTQNIVNISALNIGPVLGGFFVLNPPLKRDQVSMTICNCLLKATAPVKTGFLNFFSIRKIWTNRTVTLFL